MLLDKLTLLLPKSKRSLDPDSQRKWLTVLLINFLTICIQIFYLYRLNFLHYKPIVNFITIPCLICNLLAFYFYYKNIYFYSALFVILPGTVDLIWLIFMAGGIGAPGVFWIAILPFFYGTFFDKKGAIIGTIITFSTYAFYYIAENYMVMPTVTTTYEAYHREKFTNLINYSLITALYYLSYTSAYEKFNKQITFQKNTIDSLFRVVLHDITNPISAAKLRLSLTQKKNPELALDKIDGSLNKAIRIIDSLRSFKAIEDGAIEIPLKAESLKKLLEEFTEESKELLDEKGITLVSSFDIEDGEQIECHRESFKTQVLTNLLTNALKFSEKDGEIYLNSYMQENKLIIELKDHGIGIPKHIQDNIFRFDKVTSRVGTCGEQGTGYGLPITKFFVESMKGEISVSSLEKQENSKKSGTTFTIRFPLIAT